MLLNEIAHEQETGVIVVTHGHRALDVFDCFLKWKMRTAFISKTVAAANSCVRWGVE
jgi:hypothetical protein